MQALKILVLVAVTLALAACQSAGQAPPQNVVDQTGVAQITQSGDSATIKTGTGESVTFSAQAPDELKNFPVPPGFTLDKDGYGSMTTQEGTVATATWVGSSGVSTAGDFYTRTLPQQGWTQTMAIDSGTGRLLTYDKGEHSAWVTIDQDGAGTRIGVLYGKQTNRPTPIAPPAQAAPTKAAVAPASLAAPTALSIAEPTAKPEAPALADASVLPAELRAIPLAAGFGVIRGSSERVAEGGVFRMATARAFGKASVKDVEAFYKQALGASWTEESDIGGETECEMTYTSRMNDSVSLNINIEAVDAGTEVTLLMVSSE